MLDTNLIFLIITVILFIAVLIFDFAFFRFRERKFDEDEPLSFLTQNTLRSLRAWINTLRQPKLGELPSQETDVDQPKADFVIPAAMTGTAVTSEVPPASRPPIHVEITADVPEGTIVNITMEVIDEQKRQYIQQKTFQKQSSRKGPSREATPSLNFRDVWKAISTRIYALNLMNRDLFIGAIIVYFLAVSIGINRYPIYFFTDEAIHANLAADFWNNGLKNSVGEFLPTYFSNGPSFGLNGVSVYVQLIPYLIFGKSVIVSRMVSALITLLGAIAVALLLKKVFKINPYWLGVLLLITAPAWFLHSRTVFEYSELAAFFAITLYFYNRYRQGEDKYIFATVIAAAITFYTHGLGQSLIGLTTILLLISDFRYHFAPERRKLMVGVLLLGILCILPYLRFYIAHSEMIIDEIKTRNSYLTDINNTPITKATLFLIQYIRGLSPLYWFIPTSWTGALNNLPAPLPAILTPLFDTDDLSRHVMLGYGDILLVFLPFALWGIGRAIRNFRQSEYRTILIAFLVSPIPATLVAIGTPRVLWMIVPWVIFITLGLDSAVKLLDRHTKLKEHATTLALFVILTGISAYMLIDALTNGPLWEQDYGLYGMQYGAQQVFGDTVRPAMEADPNLSFVVSPSWANGAEEFTNFFIPPELQPRLHMGQPIDFLNNLDTFATTEFVATGEEFNTILRDQKFIDVNVIKEIPCPNGVPCFYVITLKPASNIADILVQQHAQNRNPIEDTMVLNGQTIRVRHSPLGSGAMADIFDNDPGTLSRVEEANPFYIDLYPIPPIDTHSVFIKTGSLHNYTITIRLYAPGSGQPVEYTQTYQDQPDHDLPPDPEVSIVFDKGPAQSDRIEIEIKDNTSGDTSAIHIRTILFCKTEVCAPATP